MTGEEFQEAANIGVKKVVTQYVGDAILGVKLILKDGSKLHIGTGEDGPEDELRSLGTLEVTRV